MNTKLLLAVLFFCYVVLSANVCGNHGVYDKCDKYVQDTILLNSYAIDNKMVYHIGDTIRIESTVSDNFSPLSGSAAFVTELNQLFINIQPYKIITSSSLPQLQFANIEFNPVVVEGQLQNNASGGYNFLYKRTTGLNNLKIGFIAGRTGLYVVACNNDRYSYNSGFSINKPNDNCTTYWGASNFPPLQQNKNYWDSIGVATVSVSPNLGSVTVTKNMRNYFIFKVVP